MMRRVAIVFLLPLSSEEGAGRKALLTIETLKELGYETTLLTITKGVESTQSLRVVELRNYKVEYHKSILREMRKELFLLRSNFLKIFTTILRGKFDIVQIHSVTRAVPQIAAFLAARMSGAKVVYFYNDLLPEAATLMRGLSSDCLLYKLLIVFEKIVFGFSDTVVVVSETMKSFLETRYDKRFAQQIQVIHPYVNFEESSKRGADRNLLERYGIPRRKPVFIYVGKLEPKIRGLENLTTAFGKLTRERSADAYLLLVGDGSARRQLEQMAVEQGIGNRVVFTGNLPHVKTIELLHEASVAVIPYPESVDTQVAMPTKIVEYMATGKIIVTSRLAQIRRILRKDATYCDTEKVDSLAAALEKSLTRVHEANDIGKRVRQKASLFDKASVKKKVRVLYESLR